MSTVLNLAEGCLYYFLHDSLLQPIDPLNGVLAWMDIRPSIPNTTNKLYVNLSYCLESLSKVENRTGEAKKKKAVLRNNVGLKNLALFPWPPGREIGDGTW